MGAVGDEYSLDDRVVKAVNAGTDLLVFSNVKLRDPELGIKADTIIADAVRDGRISRLRIEKAYGKIMLLKQPHRRARPFRQMVRAVVRASVIGVVLGRVP